MCKVFNLDLLNPGSHKMTCIRNKGISQALLKISQSFFKKCLTDQNLSRFIQRSACRDE